MNVQHSSRSDRWFTPEWILEKVRRTLGGRIDLDPASEPLANARVRATRYLTELDDALNCGWGTLDRPRFNVFLNPPGGKIKNRAKTQLFWAKLMEYRGCGMLTDAVFMCFSVEAMQTTQNNGCPSVCDFISCIPKKRIPFVFPAGNTGFRPSHSNCIVYIPGIIDNSDIFVQEFSDVGAIVRGLNFDFIVHRPG